MAKITIPDIGGNYMSATKINNYFQLIQDQLNNNVWYRDNPDGEPNQLENDMDCNGYTFYNLGLAIEGGSPITLDQLEQILDGYNTSYTGTARELKAASEGQTVFTLFNTTYTPHSNDLHVFLNGRLQHPGAYEQTNANTITFSEPLSLGDEVLFEINGFPINTENGSTTPESTWAEVLLNNIGYDATYTVVADTALPLDWAYGYVRCENTIPISLTINNIPNMPDGAVWHVRQAGTGTVTLTAGVGVTLNAPAGGTLEMGGTGATVSIKKVSDTEYDVMGQVEALP